MALSARTETQGAGDRTGTQSLEAGLRNAQMAVGAIGVVVFLYTGWYMRAHFPAAYEPREAIRYLYRANHLYVMFASTLNLVVGRALALPRAPWRRAVQVAGSVALVVSTAALIAAFFLEPPSGGAMRKATLLGCVLAFGGSLLHVLSAERQRRPTSA